MNMRGEREGNAALEGAKRRQDNCLNEHFMPQLQLVTDERESALDRCVQGSGIEGSKSAKH